MEGIHAVLEKQGQGYATFVPWDAIGLIMEESTGARVLWPVNTGAVVAGVAPRVENPPAEKKSARGHLRLLSSPPVDEEGEDV